MEDDWLFWYATGLGSLSDIFEGRLKAVLTSDGFTFHPRPTSNFSRASVAVDGTEYPIALKEPRVQGTLHADVTERFEQEAGRWAKLDDHDHIVDVIDYGLSPLPWIAMEYMDAGSLGDRAGEIGLQQGLWVSISVADAVLSAHRRGVVHLDLKPENVLFRTVTENAWDVPKVADWGLSQLLLEHTGTIEGMTPQYAAPEQLDENSGPADQVTDVYQLGATLYELFTGQPPYTGRPTEVVGEILNGDVPRPTAVDPSLPTELDGILRTAIATEKDDRYEDLIYFRDDLADLSADLD